MPEIEPLGEPASVGTLIARALHVIRGHWVALLAAIAGTLACEGAIHTFAHTAHVDEFAQLLVPQVATAIAYALAGADALGQPPRGQLWVRVLERLWAVVIVNAVPSAAGLAAATAVGTSVDAQTFFMQLALMLVAILLAFADVAAVIQPDLRMRDVLPFSIARSARLVANTLIWMRVLGLMIVDALLMAAVTVGTQALARAGLGVPAFWAYAGASTLITVTLAVFLALLYVDADLRDRIAKRSAGD